MATGNLIVLLLRSRLVVPVSLIVGLAAYALLIREPAVVVEQGQGDHQQAHVAQEQGQQQESRAEEVQEVVKVRGSTWI
jgi:hypothetical protein